MKWQEMRLDELGSVSRGRSRHRPRDAAHLYGGPYPFVQTGDIKHANLYLTQYSQTYSDAGLEQSKMWPKGTLCITIAANIAETAILGIDACFPDSVIGFIANESKADVRFLKFTFDIVKQQYRQVSRGAAQDNLSLEKLLSFKLKVPLVQEQRRIADILSAYDDLIENNQRRIALLEEAARLLYREWFVRLRFPGHEHTRIVDGVPEGWKRKPLSALCTLITDGAHRSPPSVDAGLPMASMKDMEDWQLNLTSCRNIRQEDFDSLVRAGCKPEVGDVLVAKDGANYLKYVLVFAESIDVVLLSSIAILRTNEQILPYLLRFSLNDPATKARLANRVSGVAIPRIVVRDFANFDLVVPPRSLQDEWWLLIEPTIRLIHVALKQNQKLKLARDLLLPRLMRGEIAV